MALSIKDERTDRLVRRYARLHNTSYTMAIQRAVGEALRREGVEVEETDQERVAREFRKAVAEAQAAYRTLPILDPRHPDDILYDETAFPKRSMTGRQANDRPRHVGAGRDPNRRARGSGLSGRDPTT